MAGPNHYNSLDVKAVDEERQTPLGCHPQQHHQAKGYVEELGPRSESPKSIWGRSDLHAQHSRQASLVSLAQRSHHCHPLVHVEVVHTAFGRPQAISQCLLPCCNGLLATTLNASTKCTQQLRKQCKKLGGGVISGGNLVHSHATLCLQEVSVAAFGLLGTPLPPTIANPKLPSEAGEAMRERAAAPIS